MAGATEGVPGLSAIAGRWVAHSVSAGGGLEDVAEEQGFVVIGESGEVTFVGDDCEGMQIAEAKNANGEPYFVLSAVTLQEGSATADVLCNLRPDRDAQGQLLLRVEALDGSLELWRRMGQEPVKELTGVSSLEAEGAPLERKPDRRWTKEAPCHRASPRPPVHEIEQVCVKAPTPTAAEACAAKILQMQADARSKFAPSRGEEAESVMVEFQACGTITGAELARTLQDLDPRFTPEIVAKLCEASGVCMQSVVDYKSFLAWLFPDSVEMVS